MTTLHGGKTFFSFQSDIHFIKLAMNKTGEEMAVMNTRVDELNLFTDKSEKLLKKARADKQVWQLFFQSRKVFLSMNNFH